MSRSSAVVVGLSSSLGIATIAVGVETEGQLARLTAAKPVGGGKPSF